MWVFLVFSRLNIPWGVFLFCFSPPNPCHLSFKVHLKMCCPFICDKVFVECCLWARHCASPDVWKGQSRAELFLPINLDAMFLLMSPKITLAFLVAMSNYWIILGCYQLKRSVFVEGNSSQFSSSQACTRVIKVLNLNERLHVYLYPAISYWSSSSFQSIEVILIFADS